MSHIFFHHLILASSNSCIVCSLPALHPLLGPLWNGLCQIRRHIWLGKLLGRQDLYFINYCFNLHTFVSFTCSFLPEKVCKILKQILCLFYVCPREMWLGLSSALLKPVVNQKQHIKEVWGRLFSTPAMQGSLPTTVYFLSAYITISQALKEPGESPAG